MQNNSGIVLFAKKSGITSFSSLSVIKKALGTKKVGHTGTLDAFAQGLLVVCTGNLTRLASRITAFDKVYEAVIAFGKETDTLDPTGQIIKEAPLPELSGILSVLQNFTGNILQAPPAFSALHVDGNRASDLMRQGIEVTLPERPVTVFSSELLEIMSEGVSYTDNFEEHASKKIQYARFRFHVSKGTYIRSLARDIGKAVSSAGYLVGLLRTQVGFFKIEDAYGFEELPSFDIKTVLSLVNSMPEKEDVSSVKDKILSKIQGMTRQLASSCGMKSLVLKEYEDAFFNGRPLKEKMFTVMDGDCFQNEVQYAVFMNDGAFCGVIERHDGKLKYSYVIPRTAL